MWQPNSALDTWHEAVPTTGEGRDNAPIAKLLSSVRRFVRQVHCPDGTTSPGWRQWAMNSTTHG